MALLNNGVQINTIQPSFVNNHSLEVGPVSDLVGGHVTCADLVNAFTQPLGYMMIWVQLDGVQGYDKDQITLVILYLSNFPLS